MITKQRLLTLTWKARSFCLFSRILCLMNVLIKYVCIVYIRISLPFPLLFLIHVNRAPVLTMMSEMRVSWHVFGSSDKKTKLGMALSTWKRDRWTVERARGIRGMRYLVCFVRIFVPIYLHIRSPILASPVRDDQHYYRHPLSPAFISEASKHPTSPPLYFLPLSRSLSLSLCPLLSLFSFILLSFTVSLSQRNAFVFADCLVVF